MTLCNNSTLTLQRLSIQNMEKSTELILLVITVILSYKCTCIMLLNGKYSDL